MGLLRHAQDTDHLLDAPCSLHVLANVEVPVDILDKVMELSVTDGTMA